MCDDPHAMAEPALLDLGGKAFRARLAKSFGRDAPAALIEDAVAIAGAVLIVLALD